MHTFHAVIMLAAGTVGLAACMAASARHFLTQFLPMGTMLVAMVDGAIPGMDLLPDIAWCLVLLLLSPLPAAGLRTDSMSLQRSLSMVIMCGLFVTGLGTQSLVDLRGTEGDGHSHSGVSDWNPVVMMLLAGSAIHIACSLLLVVQPVMTSEVKGSLVGRPTRSQVEAISSVLMIGAMATMQV